MIIPSADILGGATTIGQMLYNRGHRSTYDRWAAVYGATGWDYDSLVPYFEQVERFIDPISGQQNGTGHIRMRSRPVNPDPVLLRLQESFNRQGFPNVNPLELGNTVGTAFYPIMADGRRTSMINTYIAPVNPFPDRLHLLSHAFIKYVTLGDQALPNNAVKDPTVSGVAFKHLNNTYTVRARREVILSANAYSAFPMLFLVGIGPAELVTRLGVPLVANTSEAFGANIQDHPVVTMYYTVQNESLFSEEIGPTVQQLFDFYVRQSGPLTEHPHLGAYFGVPNGDPNEDLTVPNGLITASVEVIPRNLTELVSRYDPYQAEKWRRYFEPVAGRRVLALSASLMRPYSTGTIGMFSQDPYDFQVYNTNYLWDRRDRVAFTEILRKMFALTEEASFAQYAQPLPGPIPACERLYCLGGVPLSTCTPYLNCLIGQIGRSSYHLVGSLRVGGPGREDAVLDPRLRVKGVKGLRVIDGSMMPEIPNSGTLAAVLMIGEKGAQMVLEDQQSRS